MLLNLLAAMTLAATPAPQAADSTPVATYVPNRVYDTKHKRFTDFESMLADITSADIAFLGEQHDDPGTHRLEAATLEGLARRRSNVVLALEMFERDVQPQLNSYLAGTLSEKDFLATSRPWPRYATDYRPMVEFAKAWKWPVIAGNIPRKYASLIARGSLTAVDTLSAENRAFISKTFSCEHDDYWDRFAKTMGDMSGHGPEAAKQSPEEKAAALEKIYQSQCAKDETMGESIAIAYNAAPPRALVVHVNGSFHSDYRLGTAERARRNLKGKRIVVVNFAPVADLDAANADELRKLGDYVVFTLAPKKAAP
jgi:uncharacterized iron-regulated protein